MRAILWMGAMAGLVISAAAVGSSALAQQSTIAPGDLKQIQQLGSFASTNDCKGVIKLGTRIVDRGSAPTLPPKLMASVYEIVSFCETETGSREAALTHAVAGTRLDDSSDGLWLERLWLEIQLNKFEDAVTTVEAMTQGRGSALNKAPIQWYYLINRQLLDAGKTDTRARLLKVLTDSSYVPNEPGVTVDGFRAEYIPILLERGETPAARTMLGEIENPDSLIDISLDPRTRALLPDDFDARTAVEKALKNTQAQMTLHSRALDYVIESASLLRMLGRADEALTLLRSVEAKIGDPSQWDDPDRIVWWWDGLARTYLRLNRFDDAVTAFRGGAKLNESGSPNISQVINLAAAQLEFGHPADVLVTMAAFDDPARKGSPYGEAQVRVYRGCANFLLGNAGPAQADFDYLVAHEQDAPAALTEMLMCRKDEDGAAASYIRRLGKVDQRVAALRALSEFDPVPGPARPSPVTQLTDQVKARPDVQAAIASAGGVRRFHVAPAEL